MTRNQLIVGFIVVILLFSIVKIPAIPVEYTEQTHHEGQGAEAGGTVSAATAHHTETETEAEAAHRETADTSTATPKDFEEEQAEEVVAMKAPGAFGTPGEQTATPTDTTTETPTPTPQPTPMSVAYRYRVSRVKTVGTGLLNWELKTMITLQNLESTPGEFRVQVRYQTNGQVVSREEVTTTLGGHEQTTITARSTGLSREPNWPDEYAVEYRVEPPTREVMESPTPVEYDVQHVEQQRTTLLNYAFRALSGSGSDSTADGSQKSGDASSPSFSGIDFLVIGGALLVAFLIVRYRSDSSE